MSEVLRCNRMPVSRQFWVVMIVTAFWYILRPWLMQSPNRQVQVDISVEPNGVSDNYSVQVPNGEILTSLDVEMLEKSWPIDDVVTLRKKLTGWMEIRWMVLITI